MLTVGTLRLGDFEDGTAAVSAISYCPYHMKMEHNSCYPLPGT